MSADATSRKRPRYDRSLVQPAFLDATSTVAATQFGARRLPEIKALWEAMMIRHPTSSSASSSLQGKQPLSPSRTDLGATAVAALQSGGRKTSARHLRRRATSHVSRKPPRRPPTTSTAIANAVPSSDGKHSRTETTGTISLLPNRRARRLVASRLQNEHTGWQRQLDDRSVQNSDVLPAVNDDESNSTATVGNLKDKKEVTEEAVHWMMTHVWHAKRFHMASLWGWKVPVMHSNRGCAAALRLVQDKCLVQDATWSMQPIWFRITSSGSLIGIDHFSTAIRRLIPDWTVPSLNDGTTSSSGQGMLHGLDCFPTRAVAPIEWVCSWSRGHTLFGGSGLATSILLEHYVYLFVHPSVAASLLALLKGVFSENTKNVTGIHGPFNSTPGGVACLKLRGSTALSCLRKALNPATSSNDSSPDDFINQIQTTDHGSCFVSPQGSCTGSATDTIVFAPCLVRCVRPRDPTSTRASNNWAVCGLDVFCDPQCAKRLFHALVLKGGACPIGLAEAAYLALECDPPVPVFPRDYPDTDQGDAYWRDESIEWRLVRNYWHGGDGRIAVSMESSPTVMVPTTLLCSSDTATDDASAARPGAVVVVRGGYGDPFSYALSTCAARPTTMATASTSMRRKRRPTRMTQPFVEAGSLSQVEYDAHQKHCTTLLQSLSLPAVLLCHIQATGKGSFRAGTKIYQWGHDEDAPIGFVTVGTFSVSRGRYHGIAVVRAALFLQAVAASRHHQSCVVAKQLCGVRELQLLVGFQKQASATFHSAAISLLA